MFGRCDECGNAHERNEFYTFEDEEVSFGCIDCVEERKSKHEWICPHCGLEIDEFTRVYYKDNGLVGCSECVVKTSGKSKRWDIDEQEDYY